MSTSLYDPETDDPADSPVVRSVVSLTNDRFPKPLLDTSDGRKYFRRWAEDHRAILRRNFRRASFFTYWNP